MQQVLTADVIRKKINGLNESVDLWLENFVLPHFIMNGEDYAFHATSRESPFPLSHLYEQLVMRGFYVVAQVSTNHLEKYSELRFSLPRGDE